MTPKHKLCVIGLGYVGLPLAVAFGNNGFTVLGYDTDPNKIASLQQCKDPCNEVSTEKIQTANLTLSTDQKIITQADIIIVTVPTPVDDAQIPDLSILKAASTTIGQNLKKGQIVVFESTVYPGCTEEICVPIIEKTSSLTCHKDWFVGYSPERINPGDKVHTFENVIKVVAGDTPQTAKTLTDLYATVVKAGIHTAPSIKVAEAAKVIENTQRDLNIALMNELALLFDKLEINTQDVLEAAGTKWNFLKFRPGLVGGHCIGVDPYYLVHKAKQVQHHTQLITAGRRINDYMPRFVAEKIIKSLFNLNKILSKTKVLVLGLTFKENVSDTRNAKAFDVIKQLQSYNITVHAHDPFVQQINDITLINLDEAQQYDCIILTTPHTFYQQNQQLIFNALGNHAIFFQVTPIFSEQSIKNKTILWKQL